MNNFSAAIPAINGLAAGMPKPNRPKKSGKGGSRPLVRLAVVGLCATLLAASVLAVAFGAIRSSHSGGPGPAASVRRPGAEAECQDTAPEMCDVWHKAGLCRSRGNECQRTCGQCADDPGRVPKVARSEACRRDNLTAAMPTGRLNAMFKRLMRDFPQHRPVSPSALALANTPSAHRLETLRAASVARPPSRASAPRRYSSLPIPPSFRSFSSTPLASCPRGLTL